jgi:hypothetical protein
MSKRSSHLPHTYSMNKNEGGRIDLETVVHEKDIELFGGKTLII